MFDEVDAPINVESEPICTSVPHGSDCVEIPILTTSDEGHRRAVSRPFRYRQLEIRRRHDLKAVWQTRRRGRGSEEERQVRAVASGVFNELLYERVSETPPIIIRCAVVHRGDSTDGHELPIKPPGQVVPLGAREYFAALHQREPAPMTERPHRLFA